MTGSRQLEHRLAMWLDGERPETPPPDVVERAMADARTRRQRPAWLVADWWRPGPLPLVRHDGAGGVALEDDWASMPHLYHVRVGRTWVIAVAVVLLVVLAGLLGAGALHNTSVSFSCPPGSRPDAPGDPAQPRATPGDGFGLEWAGAGRIVQLGDVPQVALFDVCSNTWRTSTAAEQKPSRPPTVYHERSGQVVAFGPGSVWTLAGSGAWSRRDSNTPMDVLLSGYDPATGLIYADGPPGVGVGPHRIWTYDLTVDRWSEVPAASGPAPVFDNDGYVLGTFDAALGQFLVLHNDWTWLFDPSTRTWSPQFTYLPLSLFIASDEMAYDSDRGQVLVAVGGGVYAFDGASRAWTTLAKPDARQPRVSWWGGTAYDPVNRRLVAGGGWVAPGEYPGAPGSGWTQAAVSAFDPDTGSWIQLLAPGTEVAP
jgi:hypothetical protein